MVDFLNEDRYKIDVTIPLHSMQVRLKDTPIRVYRKAYNEWKEKLSASVVAWRDDSLYYSLGGLNRQITNNDDAAFALVEIGPYHKGLEGRQIYLECSMGILNTKDGITLDCFMSRNGKTLNGKIAGTGNNICKISYYMRGFVEFDGLGEIDRIEFDQVTAACSVASNFSTEIRKIFNKELYKLCPSSIQETFDTESIYTA